MSDDYLPIPKSTKRADQCREMGIQVGDTIEGREEGDGWYHEARMTLKWLGDNVAVWMMSYRCHGRYEQQPEWTEPFETANWTLYGRRWRKVSEGGTP